MRKTFIGFPLSFSASVLKFLNASKASDFFCKNKPKSSSYNHQWRWWYTVYLHWKLEMDQCQRLICSPCFSLCTVLFANNTVFTYFGWSSDWSNSSTIFFWYNVRSPPNLRCPYLKCHTQPSSFNFATKHEWKVLWRCSGNIQLAVIVTWAIRPNFTSWILQTPPFKCNFIVLLLYLANTHEVRL